MTHPVIIKSDREMVKRNFFDLPIIVNNARYEEILTLTQGYMNTVNNFSKNMTEATNSANGAAATANNAASTASAAAKACQGIVNGLNTMVDTVTKNHVSSRLRMEF